MGKGIKNRGTQVHHLRNKLNKKFKWEDELDMEETYTFRQMRTFVDRDDLSGKNYKVDDTKVQFDASTLPEVLDQMKYFLVSCGFTYVKTLTATSKLDDKTWNSSEERV
tara:strand:+ start:12328 stop:12654 length:327 start_codon:yes stop_codon:yes gene_type:complete